MKKSVVIILALVLGIAGTAFAAASNTNFNSSLDVPAKHWSYDAVAYLTQAGIIDGYGDGTFRGDKTITRYEMAQLVYKALLNESKADVAQKALIDKLAVEYALEMNKIENLDSRLAKVEKSQPTISFSGTVDIRYTAKDFVPNTAPANQDRGTNFESRFRFEALAKVDDSTNVGFRIVNFSPQQVSNPVSSKAVNGYGLNIDKTWSKFGNDNTAQGVNAAVDRYFINKQAGKFNITLGRQALYAGSTLGIIDSTSVSFDGVKLNTNIGEVNARVEYGRLASPIVNGVGNNNQIDIQDYELSRSLGKLCYTGGYLSIRNNGLASNYPTINHINTNDLLSLYYANAKYLFDPKTSVQFEVGRNKSNYATNSNNFAIVWATFGNQTVVQEQDHNIQFRYYNIGKYSQAEDDLGGLGTWNEGVKFGTRSRVLSYQCIYNYALSKNLVSSTQYFIAKGDGTTDYKEFREMITVKF